MSLILHPTKGVNSRVTICVICGKANGVILLGIHNNKYICRKCKTTHYGPPEDNKCGKCGDWDFDKMPIEETEKLPVGKCDECKETEAKIRETIAAGGIYWKCSSCHSSGAIKGCSPIAKAVREHANMPEGPVGVELSKDYHCPVCNKEET